MDLHYSKTSKQRRLWGQYIFICCVLCREVLGGSKCTKTIQKAIISDLESVLCTEVCCFMSLSESVHYWRFYCNREEMVWQ